MMRFPGLLCLGLVLSVTTSLSAQRILEGQWRGTLTNGLSSNQGYPFELFLKVDKQKVSGRSYVYLPDGKFIEMEVHGVIYEDFSIYLEDLRLVAAPDRPIPDFLRKYQLAFKGDIWKKNLYGYWQEVVDDDPTSKRRRLGKIVITKVENSKA
ncbi:MAG: hypothetical protein H6555_00645 [Lewinellaceae bacterium]|nr:hypothetical protein [Lewinellaceae bacterium]